MANNILDQIRSLDGGKQYRSAQIRAVDAEKRTLELAFSSEEECERWYGFEVLSHDPESVVLRRLDDSAALLLEHDWDRQIGVVESVSIDTDRRGRAVVRFGKSALAEEIFQDVKDGIRRHVSVGYLVHEARVTGTRDGRDIVSIESWEPYEISVVAVPYDISVGFGRSLESAGEQREASITNPDKAKEQDMTPITEPTAPDNTAAIRAASDTERARTRSILEMGEKYNAPELARDFARDGKSVDEFQRALLDHVNGKIQRPLADQMSASDVGLSDTEARSFSFVRVIRALAEPTDARAQRDAGFEFEVSRAAADKMGRSGDKFCVPTDVITRALSSGTSGGTAGNTGGFGIATTLLTQSFVEILRNRATIMQLGSVLGGLVGNIDIPKQTAASTGYWLGEDADATETNPELGQLSLSPKTVAAFSEITRKLMVQSSLDVEALVRFDLAKALALTIDKAGYYGSGSSQQPLGIANHTGINAVSFGALQPTFTELVDMETQISLDNADVNSMAYVGNAAWRGAMKTALKFPGVNGSATIWEQGGTVNGYKSEITNQITTGDVFMGNFADLLIGMWGGLELLVDPYSNSKKGRLRVVVFQDVDFALRRVESFCFGT